MLEVFTVGGGEYIVNTFNAVAAWTGGGGYRSMLQVVMVMGLAYSLLVVAFSLDWRAWLNWFLQATMIYMMLLVPTVTVKVTDRINPGLAPAVVSNVPLGLGVMASFTSQIGDWMTRTAETVFVMPNALQLSNNGMVYGARLFDKAQAFQITDAEFRANLDEHMKQCVFYDVLLGFKSMDTLTRSGDLWAVIGPGSPARGQKWITRAGDGTTSDSVLPCNEAYGNLDATWGSRVDKDLIPFAKQAYPKLANDVAAAKLRAELPVVAGQLHGATPADAFAYLRQVSMIDAFRAARESFSDSRWDAYAAQRADAQARNTYTSIAQQAMTWVPLLNIVLTVVFYAMFPVLFPLFLFPRTGVPTLKGYATGFFYLAAWGPLYVVLHMFVMSRAADAVAALAPSGPTLLVSDGIQAVNNDVATIAGFLMMSVPFLAAGMARGALAIAGQATSMLAPAQAAAEAAAVERTTGNYAYGNLSYANTTANMLQANKWDTTPQFGSGFANDNFRNADGTSTGFMSSGAIVYNSTGGMSVLPMKASVSSGWVSEARQTASELWGRAEQTREAAREEWGRAERLSNAVSSGSRTSVGSQSSSGYESGSSTVLHDRTSRSRSDGTSSGREIGQSLTASEGQNDRYTAGNNTNWGLGGNLGLPAGRGARQGSGAGNRSLGLSGSLNTSASDGVQFDSGSSETRNDSSRQGQSTNFSDDHSNSRDVSTSDGTYSKSGSFSQSERFASNTTTAEQAYDHSRRLSREAAQLEDHARRLEEAASYAESNGFTINEDMSQYLASRYIELQNGEMRDLNLPDLYRTNLNQPQRQARDYAIQQIMQDFIRAPLDEVEGRLVKPEMGVVPGPSSFTREDLRAGLGGPSGSVGGGGGAVGDQGRGAAIAAGRAQLDGEQGVAEVMRGEAVRGAGDLRARHNERTDKAWFSDRK